MSQAVLNGRYPRAGRSDLPMSAAKIKPPPSARPFVKSAGGKTQLVPVLRAIMGPERVGRFVEPFAGGAALFFALAARKPAAFRSALLNDTNPELAACYRAIRDDVDSVIERLAGYTNTEATFRAARAMSTTGLSDVQRAVRAIFLNKTGFNGLWRVNRAGQFNVPFANYTAPAILDVDNLRLAHGVLQGVEIGNLDFDEVTQCRDLRRGDFAYFDPPYVPASDTANFTTYTSEGFSWGDHVRLAERLRILGRNGVRAMLSNADTPRTRELYRGLRVHSVQAKRSINSDGKKRGEVGELVVTTWEAAGVTEVES